MQCNCKAHCYVPAILGTIALLVLIFAPIYYYFTMYEPDPWREYSLPYQNGNVRLENVNGHTMCYILRDDKIVQAIQLHNLGDDVIVRNDRRRYFAVVGTRGRVTFQIIQYSIALTVYIINQRTFKYDGVVPCFELRPNDWSWFGGPAQSRQYWPIDKLTLENFAYLTKREDHCSVAERYWLNSAGSFIYVDASAPLFVNQNVNGSTLCLHAKKSQPYITTHTDNYEENMHSIEIGVARDAKVVHKSAISYFLFRPKSLPDERMVKDPIWSTWARYKSDVNESTVQQLADEIESHEFKHSQIEIDDSWEECYGTLSFNETKFPNIKNLTDRLMERGFRTTLWMHPFVNKECEAIYAEASEKGFLVADQFGEESIQWWQSGSSGRIEAAHIDFTKPEAAMWFTNRVKKLQKSTGIDSFNFDYGESSWIPKNSVHSGYKSHYTIAMTRDYVRAVSKFGPMVGVRSASQTQDLPIFLRMNNLDSNWSWNNGFPNLITKLLQLNMVGYGFVLPAMIGGDGYDGQLPDKELFIRWVQANVFMPSFQYSYVPWDYDDETIAICKKYTELHATYAPFIIQQLGLAIGEGNPVNPPIWWLDPLDQTAHRINDEFLLGESILSAPVMQQGQVSRHIYLPKGNWTDGNSKETIVGPKWLMDYAAPLNLLPYFIRVENTSN